MPSNVLRLDSPRWVPNCPLVFLCLVLFTSVLRSQDSESLVELEQAAQRAAANKASACVVQIETFGGLERVGEEVISDGPTTGTILTADGWIISSMYSFRQNPSSILVNLPGDERIAARLVATDFARELVLLKVDVERELPFAQSSRLDLSSEDVGSLVVGLGKIYSRTDATQSVGILSAVGRAYGRAVQTDAKISPVNYGGPLVDLEGRVIGILTPISPGTFFEGNSAELYDSGIGFAVPLKHILPRLERLQAGEDIKPGKLGIIPSSQNELAGPVVIVGALPGSAAARAGLMAGDVILSANGQPVEIFGNLRHAIASVDAGEELNLSVLRDSKQLDNLRCELTESIPIYRRRYLGFRLESPTSPASEPAEGEQVTDSAAFQVLSVDEGSPAAKAGLRTGMQLTELDGAELTSTDEIRKLIAVAELDRPIVLTARDGKEKSELKIVPAIWPDEIAAELKARLPADESDNCSQIDIRLGDLPNKITALVPPKAAELELGLLVLYPEPGKIDVELVETQWSDFCKNNGWIIVAVQSADPKRWSMEEIETAERVLGRMQASYNISPSRLAVGGLGIGGRVALVAGSMLRDRISGVLTIGTDLKRLNVRRDHMPLQSLDYLLVANEEGAEAAAEKLRSRGYSAISLNEPALEPARWATLPQAAIEGWLEGLSRF